MPCTIEKWETNIYVLQNVARLNDQQLGECSLKLNEAIIQQRLIGVLILDIISTMSMMGVA